MTLPSYPASFWLVATLSILILGVDKSGFGGGVGMLATPLLALVIPVPQAAALLMPLYIVADVMALRHYHRTFDRQSLAILLPGGLLGIFLGTLAFHYLTGQGDWLRKAVGLFALVFVCLQAGRTWLFGVLAKHRPPALWGSMLGVLTGFGSTLIHAGGPFAVIYLLPQQLPRELFVGTTVILFALMNWIKLLAYAYLGILRWGNLSTVMVLAPVALFSVWLGVWLNQRFNQIWFQRVVYALLLVTGLELLFG